MDILNMYNIIKFEGYSNWTRFEDLLMNKVPNGCLKIFQNLFVNAYHLMGHK